MRSSPRLRYIRPVFEHSARLRYEDFVADPRGRLAAVLAELGLGDYREDLGHVHRDRLDLPQSHGVAGNPSRFEHGVVSVRADEAWRERLPASDRRMVTAVTAPWLLQGYPLQPSLPHPQPPTFPASQRGQPSA